jgi:hypothetical protein
LINSRQFRERRIDSRTGREMDVTRTVFVTDDGLKFSSYSDALRHEQLQNHRNNVRHIRRFNDNGELVEEELPDIIDEYEYERDLAADFNDMMDDYNDFDESEDCSDDDDEIDVHYADYVERIRKDNIQAREDAAFRERLRRMLEQEKEQIKPTLKQIKKREGKEYKFEYMDMPEIEEVKPYTEKQSKGRRIFVLRGDD